MRSARMLLWIASLTVLATAGAHGYGDKGHQQITQRAFHVLAMSEPASYDFYLTLRGQCPEIQDIRTRDSAFSRLRPPEMVIEEASAVNSYRDVEFIIVKGGIGDGGRDDPHKNDIAAVDDVVKTEQGSMSFTAFNHFIDIAKGSGTFDDYDGYSYRKGSARKNQYEKAAEDERSWAERLAEGFTKQKVDEAINYSFNDRYAHVAGQSWCNSCSPAMERYSFFQDQGGYASLEEELVARFPLANSTGASGRGIPYSIFMPVDNMARYWYGRFVETKDPLAMAPVLHAVQDASIPHHATGHLGNWHSRYEKDLDSKMSSWLEDLEFVNRVGSLVAEWTNHHSPSPASLKPSDWSTTPSIDWRVDQLVTWVALNAYEANRTAQGSFKDRYRFNESSAKRMATISTAMSVLVLKKAEAETQSRLQGSQTPVSK